MNRDELAKLLFAIAIMQTDSPYTAINACYDAANMCGKLSVPT